ncbi:MAG: D-glycerate dehydrogenase [Anaerolineae bacterium]|nr:D-glycerate dehydrogenase [Anaerolineae bacterium]MDQ7036517.1 D-glycerate dehydrogenase [Anaerolineae bacterium]
MPDSKPRVFITRTIPEKALKMIAAACEVIVWDAETPPPRPKLLDELALADGVVSMLTEKIDREALDAAPKLRIISNYAVGYDNVDIEAASERDIPVGNTPGVLTETTADQAFMLLLAAARRLPESIKYVKEGQWQTWFPLQMLGQEVSGATLGIIGLGRIGYAMTKRAKGFGMKFLYHGGSTIEYVERSGAKKVDLETLLTQSDFISIHAPLNDDTRGMIGAEELKLMKNTAILINTARGGVIQTDALLHALKNNIIASAALDVTDPEPLPSDHPLLALDNCIVVPHLGSATHQTRERMGEIAAENLLLGLRGEHLTHCVNPQVYQN